MSKKTLQPALPGPIVVPPGTAPTQDLESAAELLKVHPKTVADLIAEGAIPAAKIGRSYVMLTRHVLEHLEREILAQTTARMRRPLADAGGR